MLRKTHNKFYERRSVDNSQITLSLRSVSAIIYGHAYQMWIKVIRKPSTSSLSCMYPKSAWT